MAESVTHPLGSGKSIDDEQHLFSDVELLALVHQRVTPWLKIDSPWFGSYGWTDLRPDNPAWTAACVKASMSWWTAVVLGDGVVVESHARQLAEASRAVQAADPRLWRRVANDRAGRRPQGRARSVYGPAKPLPRAVVPAGSAWSDRG